MFCIVSSVKYGIEVEYLMIVFILTTGLFMFTAFKHFTFKMSDLTK